MLFIGGLMARIEKYNKEYIMEKLVEYTKNNGLNNFNVRDVASFIGCSTQPLFKIYKNTDELKSDLKKHLHDDYDNFISKYVDYDDYLFTISYAYALYAKKVPNVFRTLFITEMAGTRTVKEVINSSWNRATIEAMTKQYNITLEQAESVYRDVRFYTHGIASQLCAKSIKLTDNELGDLIRNMISLCINGL